MIDKARKYFAPILSVDRRVSVGTSVLAIVVLSESVLGQVRHFTW